MSWNAATGVSLTVITDCCHSGTITRTLEPTDPPTIERYLPSPWDLVAVESRLRLRGTTRGTLHRMPEAECATRDIVPADMPEILITGYRADQTSADAAIGGGFPGPLTYHLVAALTQSSTPLSHRGPHDQTLRQADASAISGRPCGTVKNVNELALSPRDQQRASRILLCRSLHLARMADNANTTPPGQEMTSITPTVFRLLRVALAAPLAAAAILSGSAFGNPATASAAPEWDIGAYDNCMDAGAAQGLKGQDWDNHNKACCEKTGGDWNAGAKKCQAPPG